MTLTVAQEILNATSDDWESLEDIYRSICLEFCSEFSQPDCAKPRYWRESDWAIPLADIAEGTLHLTETGLLEARREDGTMITKVSSEAVWRCWFHITEKGRSALKTAHSS